MENNGTKERGKKFFFFYYYYWQIFRNQHGAGEHNQLTNHSGEDITITEANGIVNP